MENLKELRNQKRKTQLQLATELDLPRTKYARYEVGESEPNIETLKRIADYFDVSIDFLVGRPRPFDFPVAATEIQKRIIKQVLQLDDEVCEIMEAQLSAIIDAVEKKKSLLTKFGGNQA